MRTETLKLFMSNAYLVDWGSGIALVDAGLAFDAGRILSALRGREVKLQAILITHAHVDHYGAAARVQRATGAPIAVHHADASAVRQGQSNVGTGRGLGRLMARLAGIFTRIFPPEPCDPEFMLEDGALLHHLGIPARVLHTPGHTAGSCSFLFSSRDLFVGDLISGTRGAHPQRYLAQDWEVLPDSLRRLLTCQPEWIFPGHGPHAIRGMQLPALIRDWKLDDRYGHTERSRSG